MANYTSIINLHRVREKYNLCDLPLHKKYRSHFEIVALILEAVKNGSVSRFSIMTNANLNCSQLKKYLQSLVEIGFIEPDVKKGSAVYKASEKGLDFLGKYYALLGTLLSASIEDKLSGVVYKTR